jgi:hypothetical protein
MRLQIALPSDVGEIIEAQAEAERRTKRQQVEFLVIKAVRERESEKRELVSAGVSHE